MYKDNSSLLLMELGLINLLDWNNFTPPSVETIWKKYLKNKNKYIYINLVSIENFNVLFIYR